MTYVNQIPGLLQLLKCRCAIFLVLLIQFTQVSAQNPTLEWAVGIGGVGLDYTDALVIDDTGNVYTCGSFMDIVDFDPGIGITNLVSNGNRDIFIQKLDANGNLIWVKSLGGSSHDFPRSITLDVNGDIYLTGYYFGTVDFDPGPGTMNLTANGISSDIFILKLTSDGDFLWATTMGSGAGGGGNRGMGIETDANGNLYITGYFSGTIDFDPGVGTLNLTSNGNTDIFVQKLDSNGTFVWAKSFGGGETDYMENMHLDAYANIYVSGMFQDTVDFDPGIGAEIRISNGYTDVFFLKLDHNGDFQWVKTMGGTMDEMGRSITTDAIGNVYVCGGFEDTIDFDPGAGVVNLTSNGDFDMFIAKFDVGGGLLWAKSVGGILNDDAWCLALDAQNNVYVAGYFTDTVDFDPGPGIVNGISVGENDYYLLKLNEAGNFKWLGTTGGTLVDRVMYVTSDDNGYVYTAGYFSELVDFDPGPGVVNFNSNGSSDAFIQKFAIGDCQPSNGIDFRTACNSYTWIDGNTYTSSNNTATDTLVNVMGCDSIVTLNLTVYTVTNVNVTQSAGTLTADIAPTQGITYTWLDCENGFAPVGVITQSFSPSTNGSYAVQVSENECLDTSACFVVSDVGIATNHLDDLSIIPNPTEDFVTITFSGNEGKLTILDLKGKLIEEQTVVSGDQVNLSSYERGIYLFVLKSDERMRVERIIKN